MRANKYNHLSCQVRMGWFVVREIMRRHSDTSSEITNQVFRLKAINDLAKHEPHHSPHSQFLRPSPLKAFSLYA